MAFSSPHICLQSHDPSLSKENANLHPVLKKTSSQSCQLDVGPPTLVIS